MYPEIFRIGNFAIHSYGLMIAIAVLVAAIAIYREAPREGINPDHVLESVIASTIVGLLGSRILYILLNWEFYSGRFFRSFFTQFEGLSFYGAMFGGVIALYFWSAWRKINFLKMADLLAPYLALGYTFGRIGCFLNGCCYGKESTLPWALPVNMADTVLRHPVQLYAALGGIIIFIILKLLRPRRPFVGFILIALFALYGLLRFITEFFRYGIPGWLNLTTAQWFSLSLLFASLAAIVLINYLQPAEPVKKRKGSRR
ncbi:MAG: prolipoprotein diacylglyceryl transferase [Bacillota bacterium]|nr:prolipoprotein diacylglyceryl transferase [Bacillota bacterium]